MKYFFISFLSAFTLLSCKNSTSTETATAAEVPTDNGGSQDDPDLVAINETIHGFYKWYETNMNALANINYVKGGKSSTLDNAQLDSYYAKLKESGFISQAYIDADKAYLQGLEATAWKNENVEEGPLSGPDYDRFFCAQDYDMAFWTAAPIGASGLGSDKATATMSGTEGGGPRVQKFELVKENGKWLIAKIICEAEAAAGGTN